MPQRFLWWLRQAVRRSWRLLSWLLQLLVLFVIPLRILAQVTFEDKTCRACALRHLQEGMVKASKGCLSRTLKLCCQSYSGSMHWVQDEASLVVPSRRAQPSLKVHRRIKCLQAHHSNPHQHEDGAVVGESVGLPPTLASGDDAYASARRQDL